MSSHAGVDMPIGQDVYEFRDDLREFLLVLRRALLMIVRWIEKRYGIATD